MTNTHIPLRKRINLPTRDAALYCAVFVVVVASVVNVWSQSRVASHQARVADDIRNVQLLLGTVVKRGTDGRGTRPAPPELARKADSSVTLATMGQYSIGAGSAPIVIVEFTDLQCPFCAKFYTTTFPQLKREYIDTGKVRFITRDFPLEKLHPLARVAAIASRCAADQNRFWEMRDRILTGNANLTRAGFNTLAAQLGLVQTKFDRCIDDPARFAADLDTDRADALSVGVTATPTFVIGRVESGVLRGTRIAGARPFPVFEEHINRLLTATAR